MQSIFLKFIKIFIIAAILSGCSNSGGTGNSTSVPTPNTASTLTFITPRTILSLSDQPSFAYILVHNPESTSINNINYMVSNQVGGATNLIIDSGSASECSAIPALGSCTIKVGIPSGTIAGSFKLSASNGTATSSILSMKDTLTAESNNNSNPTIGVGQAQYNNLAGADGVTLNYYKTVPAGTEVIQITGVVASSSVGEFNNAILIDNNGNPLPHQEVISGNLGAGLTNLSQGDTFSILLQVPNIPNSTQTIKVKTEKLSLDGIASNIQISNTSSTLTIVGSLAVVNLLPATIYLTSTAPEQYVTFNNIGDTEASLTSFQTNNSDVEVVFNTTSLAPGGTSTALLKLRNSDRAGNISYVTLNYNNGSVSTPSIETVYTNVGPIPSPTSTPIPIAKPGLLAELPENDFFTSTAVGTVSQQMTLSNSGNTSEAGITFNLPANFTISSSNSGNTCSVTSGSNPATISNTLAPNNSCNVTVTYSNSTVTNLSNANIGIAYTYNGGMQAPDPSVAYVHYRVTQSTANLKISPFGNPVSFGSIYNNNIATTNQLFTLTNSGDVSATNIGINYTGTNADLFSTNNSGVTTPCGSTLGIDPNSYICSFKTIFGPSTLSGNKVANISVNYTPYVGSSTNYAIVKIAGQINQSSAANIVISGPISGGFAGGFGTNASPYQIKVSTPGTLTYTYTNSGTGAASNFYVTNINLPTGWTRGGGTCTAVTPGITLNKDANCTVIFTINSNTNGAKILNQNVMTANWTDDANPNGISQPEASNPTYVNVYTVAIINIVGIPNPINNILMGNAFQFTATLSGGYNVPNQTVTATTATPGVILSSSPATCVIHSDGVQVTTCTFRALTTWITTAANTYQILLSNSGNAALSTNSLSYGIIAPTVYLPETNANETPNVGVAWPSPRFVVGHRNEANCMTDELTGLMWSKNADLFGAESYTSAQIAINAMNTTNSAIGYDLCGHTDWRLPTINELAVMLNYSYFASENWLGSQGFTRVRHSYWTSTNSPGQANSVWYAFLAANTIGITPTSSNFTIWPVRNNTTIVAAPSQVAKTGPGGTVISGSGVEWPSSRFVLGSGQQAPCITDKLTGLMWPVNATLFGTPLSVSANQSAVNAMNTTPGATGYQLCGYSDWRIPNINELKSLINYNASNLSDWLMGTNGQVCDGACFSNIALAHGFAGQYMSSTISSSVWLTALSFYANGTTDRIDISTLTTSDAFPVWPVRGGYKP